MNLTLQIIILIVLLILSAFFSSAETALTTISPIRVRNLCDKNKGGADTLAKLISNKDKLLTTILIGNNLVNIGASSLATSIAINLFGNTGVGVATGIMTFLVLIFGEITPKTFATLKVERVSLMVAKPVYFLTIIFAPLVFLFSLLTKGFLWLMGVRGNSKMPVVTQEELKTIIDMGHEEGVLDKNEKDLISNVFKFNAVVAEDIMIPRADMAAISIHSAYQEFIELFQKEKFSKLPVYDEDIDDIKGIVHLKDLLFYQGQADTFSAQAVMREVMFTFEFKPVSKLFSEMQTKGQSCAVVLDEYGGTLGFITMHDLIEEVVGEIDDEHDNQESIYRIVSNHEMIAEGSLHLDTFDKITGLHFEEESDSQTIAGYLLELFGRIPFPEESITHNSISFRILEIHNNRINRIFIDLGETSVLQEPIK